MTIPRHRARVLIVGIGGLGCPSSMILARAGVGTLGLVDDDEVSLSNLHRQILFAEADVGRSKTMAAEDALKCLAPGVSIERYDTRLLPSNAVELVGQFDLVVEGSDNFATKFLTADACAIAGVPVVHGAAVRWVGTAFAVSGQGRPCYRCVFEDLPTGNPPNCAEAGVLGPAVGIVAAIQADLALGTLDGRDRSGTLVSFDARTDTLRSRQIRSRAGCILCDPAARPFSIELTESRYLVSPQCGASSPTP